MTATGGTGHEPGPNNPTAHDPATAAIRGGFFRPLVDWLVAGAPADGIGRLLDFGCGDLLIAPQLAGSYVVDGYDEASGARAEARRTLRRHDLPGQVFDRREDLPEGAYDAVVVGSMLQYVPDADSVVELLGSLARHLRPGGGLGVIATDAVVVRPNRLVDLRDLVRFLLRHGGPAATARRVVLGVRSGRPSVRHRLQLADLEVAADRAGVELVALPRNLTTFTRRTTLVVRAPERVGPATPEADGA